jgi:hypothetical protein
MPSSVAGWWRSDDKKRWYQRNVKLCTHQITDEQGKNLQKDYPENRIWDYIQGKKRTKKEKKSSKKKKKSSKKKKKSSKKKKKKCFKNHRKVSRKVMRDGRAHRKPPR